MKILAVCALALVLPGCPADDACGPAAAAGDGLVVTDGAVELRFHDLAAGANNDCPDPAAPAGVVSLTIAGTQVGGSGAITLCVPRPDLFAEVRGLGTDVRVVDLEADAQECSYHRNTQTAPTGSAHAEGLCADGTDPAGFALVVDGTVALDRTCLASTETVTVTIAGTVSVAGP